LRRLHDDYGGNDHVHGKPPHHAGQRSRDAGFGLGVFQSSPERTAGAVQVAVANGYRLIDTVAAYFNERQVAEGIRRSGIDRSENFVTTKLWISDYGYERALHAFDTSRRKLGLDYVDL
jgi:diketogulonate reductase-like aldo/keto reductase